MGGIVPLDDGSLREDPDVPRVITGDTTNDVALYPFGCAVCFEGAVSISRYAAGLRAEPKIAVGGTLHRADAVASEPGCIAFVEDGEVDTVKPREAVEGRDPDIAVSSLVNAANDVLRESIVSGKGVKAILRPNGNCDRRNKEEETKKKPQLVLALWNSSARLVICRLWAADCHGRSLFLVVPSALLGSRAEYHVVDD